MTPEQRAKELGYYIEGNNIMTKRGHLAPQYHGGTTKFFSFRFDDVIYTARFDKFKALFREKSQHLATSETKKKRDREIMDFYLSCNSRKQTIDKFKISVGGLHLIIKRNENG